MAYRGGETHRPDRAEGDRADPAQIHRAAAQMAKELYFSGKTVESHVSSVLHKLQLSNRHELARWANDRRLI